MNESGLRSPLDEAILAHGAEEGIDAGAWRKIDEVPFDFERRRVSVLVERDGERLLVVKGAPEDVLRLSATYEGEGPEDRRPLTAEARARLEARFTQLGEEGLRALGIAWRAVPPDHPHAVVDETALCFAGFAAFLDPPKQSAAPCLQALARDGVALKILTGDNERVTRHVCKELGLEVTGVLLGSEIGAMDEPALQARAEAVNLFCRVTPAQKHRVLLALKARGRVVGYLGDGINDDLSETTIPLDEVDAEYLGRPHRWDMGFVPAFMLVLGPVSSVFDLLTFGVLLWAFRAGEDLFHTGWFIESICTQVLVIFVIRTRGSPLRSRPSPVLVASSLGVVALAILSAVTPVGRRLGFVPPPPSFFAALAALVAAYLGCAEGVKRLFYRWRAPAGAAPRA